MSMKNQEIENTKAVISASEDNIKGWMNLQNRELAIMPTDSKYYKKFKVWIHTQGGCFDDKEEQSPLYISGNVVTEFLDIQIARNQKHLDKYLLELQELTIEEKQDEIIAEEQNEENKEENNESI